MSCRDSSQKVQSVVQYTIKKPEAPTPAEYKLCIYRLADDPDRIYVKVVGNVVGVSLVGGIGVTNWVE